MRLVAIAVTALTLATTAAADRPIAFRATLTAGTHHPAVNTRWPYAVRVVDVKGNPLRARISVAIVDPLGGIHPTQYYLSTKYVTSIPFRGTFRDAVRYPPESRSIPLTFRVTLKVGTATRVLRYPVTPG